METREDPRRSVKAWMSPPSHTVTPETPVAEASRRLRQHRIRHLLVIDHSRLVGVVSDRDLRDSAGPDRELDVAKVMTAEPITVGDDEDTGHAAQRMVQHQIGCLPVMRNQECVGIVTSTDLLKALAYAIDPDAAWSLEMPASA